MRPEKGVKKVFTRILNCQEVHTVPVFRLDNFFFYYWSLCKDGQDFLDNQYEIKAMHKSKQNPSLPRC